MPETSLPPAVDSMTVLVAAVIVHDRERGRMVLIRRGPRNKFAPGCWDLPVGKNDAGEPILATAVRELEEETGIVVDSAALRLVHIIHGAWGVQAPNGFVTVIFAAHEWSGEPRNREPEKHSHVGWVDVGALPEPTVPAIRTALEAYLGDGPTVTLAGW